ncbi:MFS transporter [Spirillospora sp. NPDC047279]|uniref:MFS transporter n=1 Tax=Spirillospora sp. NPDC047279 TaxID=3155478 RepID=UPI0033EAFCB5
MTAPATESRAWTGAFAGLCAAVLLTFTAFGAAVPVLPRLITTELDGGPLVVGAAFGISAVAALLSRPYVGRLAQRGDVRTVIAAGAATAALVGAGYAGAAALGGTAGTGSLLVLRVIMGVAEAATFTAGSLWVVSLAPEDRRGQLVGWYGLSMWGGWTLGPLIGETLRRESGYGAVWLFHIMLPLLAVPLALRLPAPDLGGGGVSRSLIPRPVLLPGTALALAAVGYAALAGFVVLHLEERGVGGGPLALTLFGAAYIVVRLLCGRLPDRAGAARIAVAAGLVEAAGLALIAAATTPWAAGLGAAVMGAGFTLLYPSLALLVINRSDASERGAALGAFTSFWDLGLGAAGLLTGAIATGLGYPAVFAAAALTALAAALTGHLAGRPAPHPAHDHPSTAT